MLMKEQFNGNEDSPFKYQGFVTYPLQWLIFQSRLSPNMTIWSALGFVFVVGPVMN